MSISTQTLRAAGAHSRALWLAAPQPRTNGKFPPHDFVTPYVLDETTCATLFACGNDEWLCPLAPFIRAVVPSLLLRGGDVAVQAKVHCTRCGERIERAVLPARSRQSSSAINRRRIPTPDWRACLTRASSGIHDASY